MAFWGASTRDTQPSCTHSHSCPLDLQPPH